MSIFRLLKWIVITCIVLVVSAVLYLSSADLNWLKPRIESAAAEATGRTLKLGGRFDLDIVPSPTIVLEDVSLSNTDWGSEPELVKIGHISARLGLWSLLTGPVRVKEFRLRDVDLLLETNDQDQANWVMGVEYEPQPAGQPETEEDAPAGVPVIVEFAEIRNIKLSYRAPEAEPFVASLASLDISTDEGQYTVLEGKGEVDALPLRHLISGDIKDPSLVPPISITLDFTSKGSTPRALASSTNGRVLLTVGTGQNENNLLATVSGDVFAKLFSALNPFSKEDEFTTTDCTILALDITNGMADITGLYSQGDKVKVVGDGNIDLNTEALNIEFNTKPRKGVGVSADMFVTPFVKLKGTLSSPTVGLDKKGALLAVSTGGLSVLAQAAADRVAGEKDNCAEVLAEVGDHPPVKN
jgi:uncharacterized protein involved in outer membrane biogenesis